MVQPRLPLALVRHALAVYEQAVADGYAPRGAATNTRGAVREAARRLHAQDPARTLNGYVTRITQALDVYGCAANVPDEPAPPAEGETPSKPEAPPAREATPREVAQAHAARDELARVRAQLRDLARAYDEASRIREAAFGLTPEAVRSPGWRVGSAPAEIVAGEVPVLFTSDFQVGENIRAEEVDGLNAYSVEIFRARYRRLIAATVHIVQAHHGGADRIVYLRGGDAIDGGLHQEVRETSDTTAPQQVKAVCQEEIAGIGALADAFGRVDVYSVPGNHDRTTEKPRNKGYIANSYDSLAQFVLERHFLDDPRVTLHGSTSGDIKLQIANTRFLLTHGDRIGTSGGRGFIGPGAPILRGSKKIREQLGATGEPFDVLLHGHFHYPLWDENVISNGTLAGYNEYAHTFRFRPSPPTQTLFFVHPEWGITALRRIQVDRLGGWGSA